MRSSRAGLFDGQLDGLLKGMPRVERANAHAYADEEIQCHGSGYQFTDQPWRTLEIALQISQKQNPHHLSMVGVGSINSLTMTYFHTGIRTIIGADSFHCPVRDGKEWYQVAMVVRHNLLPP